MDEQIKSIDVEAIMKEIRQQIAARGEVPSVLDIDEAMADKECAEDILESVKYDEKDLHRYLAKANLGHHIPYYQMIPRGGIKSFIKRAIRKIIAFVVLPLRDQQNVFNAFVIQTLLQLEAYTLEQEETVIRREQDRRFAMQEVALEKMAQRLAELEKKYEELLAEKEQ